MGSIVIIVHPCGSYCECETRECYDGVLQGSYIFPDCTMTECRSCVGPDGRLVVHSYGSQYYQSPTGRCDSYDCYNYEWRVCYDGNLTGSYTAGSCQLVCYD